LDAQVMFKSGAVVEMTGPCPLQMIDAGRGHLRHGSVSVYVPDQATGFILDAPRGVRVIDMGTASRPLTCSAPAPRTTTSRRSVSMVTRSICRPWIRRKGPSE